MNKGVIENEAIMKQDVEVGGIVGEQGVRAAGLSRTEADGRDFVDIEVGGIVGEQGVRVEAAV